MDFPGIHQAIAFTIYPLVAWFCAKYFGRPLVNFLRRKLPDGKAKEALLRDLKADTGSDSGGRSL